MSALSVREHDAEPAVRVGDAEVDEGQEVVGGPVPLVGVHLVVRRVVLHEVLHALDQGGDLVLGLEVQDAVGRRSKILRAYAESCSWVRRVHQLRMPTHAAMPVPDILALYLDVGRANDDGYGAIVDRLEELLGHIVRLLRVLKRERELDPREDVPLLRTPMLLVLRTASGV